MKKKIFYIIILILLLSNRSVSQQTKNNLFTGGGLSFPYNHDFYRTAGLHAGIEYLKMLDLANGIAFQIDFQRFNNKSKLLSTTSATISVGWRHRLTESYYVQLSVGGNTYSSSTADAGLFSGSAEIRSGFYVIARKNTGYDLSVFLRQTTNSLGWFGLRAAINLPLKKGKR